VNRLLATAATVDVFVVTEDSGLEFGELFTEARVHAIETTPGLTAIQKWNYGFELVNRRFDAFFLGADDLVFGQGWLDEVIGAHERTGAGCIAVNDGITDGNQLGTHYLLTKDFIRDHNGGTFVCPHFRSWCIDVEVTARAKRAGSYVWADKADVEHRHVHFGKAEMDDTYKRGYAVHQYDQFICELRRRAGWPDDYVRLI
jgi:hypothetical protein